MSSESLLLQKKADEKTPLIASPRTSQTLERLAANETIKNYDVKVLASYRVVTMWTGTVFEDRGLWMETLCLAGSFCFVFVLVYFVKWDGFHHFVGKEENIRALMDMFCTLIGLLLSFYTALNLGRWWQMRMKVHQIEGACAELVMNISQTCTDDRELLSAVQRYARASLFMIFAASQEYEDPREEAFRRGLLTEDEAEQLGKLNPHMTFVQAETLWVWLANLVNQLHVQGLTKGPPHYCQLLKSVEQGRDGVAEIETYLMTQIPLGYVHLLCLMVKLHNFLLNILQALITVSLLGDNQIDSHVQAVPLFRSAFRAFFMPFLYNCLLILNTAVSDPFGNDSCDFDFRAFDVGMECRANTFAEASSNLPKWMKDKRKFDPVTV